MSQHREHGHDHAHQGHAHHAHDHATQPAAPRVKDPVCGMTVDPRPQHRAEHGGKTYHFCSAGCRERFVADPAKFRRPSRQPRPAPATATAIYTCPMHPEIRQTGPGACPICGMALEPDDADVPRRAQPRARDMTRRFWIGLVLTVPVLALEMGGHLHRAASPARRRSVSSWMQLVLATPVVLWAGLAVLRARLAVARQPQPEHVHADRARASGVAWLYSVVATARARRLSRRRSASAMARSRSTSRPRPSSPCSCCSGRCWSCGRASRPAARSARCSTSRRRRPGGIGRDGTDEDVPLEAVAVGDRLRVRPGEKVPVDGVVLEGRAPSTSRW